VLNLRAAAVPDGFERVLEVVPADDSARGPLRERWKQYQARGLDLKKHDM
jgi:DNA polymerase-3 subunit chi